MRVIQAVLDYLRTPYTPPWVDPLQFAKEFGITLAVVAVLAKIALEVGTFRHGENDRVESYRQRKEREAREVRS